jgi:peroxiredoxin
MLKQLFKRKNMRNKGQDESAWLLPVGSKAPGFTLPATNGDRISLTDFRGRPVVLVFYPADKSPVCSNQLALYNEALPLFQEHNAQLMGVSVDDVESHQEFADQLDLNFPLLADSDPSGAVSRAYRTLSEKDRTSERAIYVLDGEGTIHWRDITPRNVNPGADGILRALESLTGSN